MPKGGYQLKLHIRKTPSQSDPVHNRYHGESCSQRKRRKSLPIPFTAISQMLRPAIDLAYPPSTNALALPLNQWHFTSLHFPPYELFLVRHPSSDELGYPTSEGFEIRVSLLLWHISCKHAPDRNHDGGMRANYDRFWLLRCAGMVDVAYDTFQHIGNTVVEGSDSLAVRRGYDRRAL